MSTPSVKDKVYEFSAQGDSGTTLFNVPQALEGKGIVNVTRCRLPSQYSTHPGVAPTRIIQARRAWFGSDILEESLYPEPFHTSNGCEFGAFSDLAPSEIYNLNQNGVGVVHPYNSPCQAINHLENAYLYTQVVATANTLSYQPAGTSPSDSIWYEMFITVPQDGSYYVNTGISYETLDLHEGMNRVSNWVQTDVNKKTVYIASHMTGKPGASACTFKNGSDSGITVKELHYVGPSGVSFTPPSVNVSGGLQVTLAHGTHTSLTPFWFDEITRYRLNYDNISSTVHSGRCQANMNDCKKIILTLKPETQPLVTRHGNQESVFQNASISFAVFDDMEGGSTDTMFSLDGDFVTNALLKVGDAGQYSFELKRFTVNPLESEAKVSPIIMPANAYTEIKYKMSPLPAPPELVTRTTESSANRPIPELVMRTTESSAKRPYSMMNGEIPINSIRG